MAVIDERSDEDLAAGVRSGDKRAFEILVQRHADRFYAAAYRTCGQVQEAEDAVQEAFLKFWRKPESFDAGRGVKFTTWFYRVVVNTALDAMRGRRPEFGSEDLDLYEDGAQGPLEMLEVQEQESRIERCVQALPERQKLALNLCFYEGLSNREAADILGIGLKALESLLMRAKSSLREQLLSSGGVLAVTATRREKLYG